MPPTNDVNEGALGSYRLFIRKRPNSSLHQYNAQAMFKRNGTEEFMARHFQESDQGYLRKTAQAVDASGLEKKHRKALMDHAQAEVAAKRKKDQLRSANIAKEAERMASVQRIDNPDVIKKMTVSQLKDQLELYRPVVCGIPLKSHMTNKASRLEALLAAVEQFKSQDITHENPLKDPIRTTRCHIQAQNQHPLLQMLFSQDLRFYQ